MKSARQHYYVLAAGVIILYLVTHLFRLTALPVFADEAIYIRWAQLIIDDWQRYAFFPLNDGKTPLLMWLMVPFQFLFSDQLFAGRFLAVLIGFFQVLTNGYLTLQFGGRKKTALLSMLLTSVLPFWYFHHRMALIDGLLTLWLSLSLVFILKLVKTTLFSRATIVYLIGLGASFGLALWTKLPAVLALPPLLVFSLWPTYQNISTLFKKALVIGSGLFLGLCFFALMKLHPAFGQLFSRGSDFLYPWPEVLFAGLWQKTLINIPTYLTYFGHYLTWPFGLGILAGLFAPRHKRSIHLLFWSGILFLAPMVMLGRVVYPRYLFPASLFFTLAGTLSIEAYVDSYVTQARTLPQKVVVSIVIVLLLANTLAASFTFIGHQLFSPDTTPFVAADKVQYLHEWSSGHGLKEAAELIAQAAQTKKIAVGTEGYFGTLPDGLTMYFHRRNVENIYIEGIGYPVDEIPTTFADRAQDYDQTWIIVNSHRMKIELPPEKLIAEYCRPDDAPCLQVWDATALITPSN
ncbi:MAG TPA: phospholipid carrier-dependent glycosyltransferase [Patescibacteria group bacterium]